jgi:2-polyprenyl-6-methoxyphenol hydroxylase-like FAD-dependent oxidoreductase
MLSPNALRLLDKLGIYQRIHDMGYLLDSVSFRDEHENELNKFYFGSKKMYQYDALRINREIVVRELLAVVEEAGIDIVFDCKLIDITPSAANRTIQLNFANDFTTNATRVIGADGIHSRVRRAIYPDCAPIYSGQLAITSSVQRSNMSFPATGEYKLPAFIFAKPGAFLMLPHDPKGKQVGIGRQWAFEERDKAGWAALAADKNQLMGMIQSNYEYWPKTAQSCLDMAKPEDLGIWPYYTLPRLKKWTAADNKIIIIGDAQHAIPPTGGQGACMAIEDAYTLGILLTTADLLDLTSALSWWQEWRSLRIDKVLSLTKQLGDLHLPAVELENLARTSGLGATDLVRNAGKDMHWLYGADLESELVAWMDQHAHSRV